MYTRKQIQNTVEAKGYKWFHDNSNKSYDVNIVGVRNSKTKNRVTNAFDDLMTISYKCEEGYWHFHEYDCTTDPGTHWVENILNDSGVAILKPGQYRGSHKIRLHQGKYEALGQKKPVTVYRDNNLDETYDYDNASTGVYGINIHRATAKSSGKSTRVDKWSAGCQVIAKNSEWHEFLNICKKAREIHGNSFSYTLLESKDISD
jgi:hypothetical protein